MKSGAIILNGISRKKKKFYAEIYPALANDFDIQIFETEFKGHAARIAADLVHKNFDFILAAGGDGTLNQVINGIVSEIEQGITAANVPAVGLIPLGTGNDFARTCHLKLNANQLIKLLKDGSPKPTDIGKLTNHDADAKETIRYFINCCSLGMGPEVVQKLEDGNRTLGPHLLYIKAIIITFFRQKLPYIICAGGEWKFEGKVRVLGIANGKSFGNGVYLAPDAEVDDGFLNVFVAKDVPTPKFLVYLHLIKAKMKLNNPSTIYRKVKSISISSPEICPLETEGELAGYLPARIEVLAKRINFFR